MPSSGSRTNCKACPSFQKSVFRRLDDQSLDRLADEKTVFSHSKNETYNVQDSPADKIYCISQGSAKITRYSKASGQQSIVRIAAPGDLLGYRCLFSEDKFRATGSALEETKSCHISKKYFMELLAKNPELSMEILNRMGQDVSSAENHHHSFCSKNVRERVAESLLILHKKSSTQLSDGYRLDIQLTRQEFASWVGTAKATVIRCLAEFKKENLIRLQDGYIVLLDIEKLVQIAG